MKKIIGIGEIVWDVLPEGKRIGGAPVNFAYFSNALGAIAYPISAVGKDALGDEALEALAPSGWIFHMFSVIPCLPGRFSWTWVLKAYRNMIS